MEGKSQVEFNLIISQFFDHFCYAGSRQSDPFCRDTKAFFRTDLVNTFKNIPVVQKWFTHSHENNIAKMLPVWRFWEFIEQFHLIVDLTCR